MVAHTQPRNNKTYTHLVSNKLEGVFEEITKWVPFCSLLTPVAHIDPLRAYANKVCLSRRNTMWSALLTSFRSTLVHQCHGFRPDIYSVEVTLLINHRKDSLQTLSETCVFLVWRPCHNCHIKLSQYMLEAYVYGSSKSAFKILLRRACR